MEILSFLSKWLHLLSIIGVLGGVMVAYLVLVPALRNGGSEETDTVKAVWKGFGRLVVLLWLVILITGFYNLFTVWPHTTKPYHRFLETKILLTLIMLGISGLLFHPAPRFARFRQNRPTWLLALLILGILAVGLSAHLNLGRVDGTYIKPAASSTPETTTP